MSGLKSDVIWSPIHQDKFIVWGPDITLYEVSRLKDIDKKTTYTQLSSTRGAVVVASQSANGVRCVDISAIQDQVDPLLALGYANGKVSLASLKQTYDPLGLAGREFVASNARPCNAVSWSQTETNLLAVAMDKYRNDHSILLWDVNRGSTPEEFRDGGTASSGEPPQPLAEMGLSETAHSVSWCHSEERLLVASMNDKFIKIFDLRELSNKAVSVASSRYCFGAAWSPHSAHLLASSGDCVAAVWDSRALTAPLLTVPHQRPVAKIQWCPARRNLLVTLEKDSNTLLLHDIQQANVEFKQPSFDESGSPCVGVEASASAGPALARAVSVGGAGGAAGAPSEGALVSFSCCPTPPASLLALTATGGLSEQQVWWRAGVAVSARGAVAHSGGGALKEARAPLGPEDIARTMRRRALNQYGLKEDLWENAELAEDPELASMWNFLALSRSLVEDGCIRGVGARYPGVLAVLRGAGAGAEGYRSEAVRTLLPDMPSRRVTLFRSGGRSRALQLCGWGWGWEQAGAGVERAEAEGRAGRAAALAAFHLRLRSALDLLHRQPCAHHRLAAIALAGLSDDRLWRESVAAAAPAMPDPYLRAVLHFLAATVPARADADPPALDPVLNETGMRLEDRVAFACMYLPDARLHEYLRDTCERLLEQGDLAALLLTGISPEGLSVLQRWVDARGDVQSAALVAACCCTGAEASEGARDWLRSYCGLLEAWRCWAPLSALARCEALGQPLPRALSVPCAFCGKSVAAASRAPRHAQLLPRHTHTPPAHSAKVSACANCRKPLPRCAVCLRHLGAEPAAAHLAAWLTWCTACRHVGHAHHLRDWFREHTECPVSSCNCRCITLDPPDGY